MINNDLKQKESMNNIYLRFKKEDIINNRRMKKKLVSSGYFVNNVNLTKDKNFKSNIFKIKNSRKKIYEVNETWIKNYIKNNKKIIQEYKKKNNIVSRYQNYKKIISNNNNNIKEKKLLKNFVINKQEELVNDIKKYQSEINNLKNLFRNKTFDNLNKKSSKFNLKLPYLKPNNLNRKIELKLKKRISYQIRN